MKSVICPVVGIKCFNDSASQPLVRRHTPIFQNHRHRYGGSCVHEQTRTRHDRNAKNAVPGCINFLLAGTGSGSTFSENADLFCNFVPRHLEQKHKNMFYFLLEGSFYFNPLPVAKKIQMNIYKSFVVTRDNRSAAGMPQTRQNAIVNALLQMKWTLLQQCNERERHESNGIQNKIKTSDIQNSYVSPH